MVSTRKNLLSRTLLFFFLWILIPPCLAAPEVPGSISLLEHNIDQALDHGNLFTMTYYLSQLKSGQMSPEGYLNLLKKASSPELSSCFIQNILRTIHKDYPQFGLLQKFISP